jgi:hypothetical protein
MGLISYLTTAEAQFGTLAWIFFISQILGVGAGLYLYFRHTERNPARQTFMRQLGIALLILGGVGVLSGVLRLLNVAPFTMRLWFWAQAVIELGVAGYVVYYMRQVLPRLEREARARGLPAPPPRRARSSAEAPAAPPEPRPVATTGRRDARRDRKRKGK